MYVEIRGSGKIESFEDCRMGKRVVIFYISLFSRAPSVSVSVRLSVCMHVCVCVLDYVELSDGWTPPSHAPTVIPVAREM